METLGDYLKNIEKTFSIDIPSDLALFVRLDGNNFSSLMKNYERPYSETMAITMQATTVSLMEKFNAQAGYTQSDEITLMWYNKKETYQHPFGGKTRKLNSILASYASVNFNKLFYPHIPAVFDSRTFGVTSEEIWKPFYWRYKDAVKNGTSQVAHHFFSNKELFGKNTDQRKSLLEGIDQKITDYPEHLQSGTFFNIEIKKGHLSEERLKKIPFEHRPTGLVDIKTVESTNNWEEFRKKLPIEPKV